MERSSASKHAGRGSTSILLVIMLLVVALTVAYVASYTLLVVKGTELEGKSWNRLYYKDHYRVLDGPAVQGLFSPANAMDRELRRSYWYATYS